MKISALIVRCFLFITFIYLTNSNADAQQFVFTKLEGTPVIDTAGWRLTGAAKIADTKGDDDTYTDELLLCNNVNWSSGACFYKKPLNLTQCYKWIAEFDYRIYDGNGADGIAFCFLVNPPTSYINGYGVGIPPKPKGIMVVLDQYHNCGGANPKLEIRYGDGTKDYNECPSPAQPEVTNLAIIRQTNYNRMKITYDNGNIDVYINGVFYLHGYYAANYSGYLGFTSSTGASNDNHSIKNVIIYTSMPKADAGPDMDICSEETVIIGTDSLSGYNYSWEPTTGLDNPHKANPSLTLTNNTSGVLNYTYKITVDSAGIGCFSSDSVLISVKPLAGIAAIPSGDTSVCQGQSGIEYSIPDITNASEYVWTLPSGAEITSGNNTNKITVSYSPSALSGNITVYGTNGCGNGTSASLAVTVKNLPAITFISASKIKCLRDSAIFLVKIEGDTLAYQWFKNGTLITDATDNVYYLDLIMTPDAGNYSCVITNKCGSSTAECSLLVLNTPVIINNIDNVIQCEGTSTTLSVTATGLFIEYQWTKNNENIPGETSSQFSILNSQLSDEGTYSCIVSNACGTRNLNPFTLTVNQKPIISTPPLHDNKDHGDNTSYTVSPGGTPPFSYQWYKNSEIIIDASTNNYQLSTINCEDAGYYNCLISNTCGSSGALIARLSINDCTGDTLSGYVLYDKKTVTPIKNVSVYLNSSEGIMLDSTTSDNSGAYKFQNIPNGSYQLTALSSQFSPLWGGSNPVDALYVNRSYLGTYTFLNSLREKAANVNDDITINPVDALLINKRYIGTVTKFSISDWLFDNPSVTINGGNLTQDIKAICAGDVDASYPKKYKKLVVSRK